MFCSSDQKASQSSAKNRKNARKKQNNRFKYIKKEISKNKYKFAVTMTSWAESFTHAATWQLKTELAYWKAKAKSLEYENEVLHNVIRENCMQKQHRSKVATETEDDRNVDSDSCDDETDEQEIYKCEDDDDDLEVSEEFVNFLRENAKFREDAKRERERLRAKQASENMEEVEAGPSKPRDRTSELKELYGDKWMKIAALENYVQSSFIHDSDTHRPMYWPNIPFNFNFS